MASHNDDLLSFLDEHAVVSEERAASFTSAKWRILIVDDEHDVHSVTTFALRDYIYLNKRLEFVSAFNEAEARQLLAASQDFALVLLDVVMTTTDGGLMLVKYIREDLDNQRIQIILRTGQPGEIPEEQMVKRYRVNDYKLKTELTRDKLFSAVTLALRSFEQLGELAEANRALATANANLGAFNQQLQQLVEERTLALTAKSGRLEEALLDKTNLLRILAHDLRNYLAVARWSGELALASTDAARTAAMIDKMLWSVDKQSSLISKVASAEALRSGKLNVVCEAKELRELLQHSHQAFEQRLLEKNICLKQSWLCREDIQVWVDPVIFLDSVLNNLVSNAIKFSSAGDEVEIEVATAKTTEVTVSIRDHGVGMPKELLDALFGYTEHTSRIGTGGERGIGFGMPIVKLSLEKMRGSISISSIVKEPGTVEHGTEVVITVPAAV